MGLFRMGMRRPRREELSSAQVDRLAALQGDIYRQLLEGVASLVQRNSREQNAATAHAIISTERQITRLLEKFMDRLDETLALVAEQKTRLSSLIALTSDLHGRVLEALGGALTPSQKMRVDAIFEAVKANGGAIDNAIVENTIEATAGAVSDGPSLADLKTAEEKAVASGDDTLTKPDPAPAS